MAELNLYNIDQITEDVRKQEIGFSHLFHDLVDHICCDIEYEMQKGLSFDEAYRKVKAKIGFRGLKKIQEETLYEVDSKYRNMKKLMKVSGVAGTVMLGFAAALKILHLPPAGILLTLGAIMLALLFLPSALNVLWKETKSGKKLILFISAFLAGVSFIFGMLFKIQHWPGASYVISFGILTGVILFVPSLLMHLFRNQEKKHKRIIYVTGVYGILTYIMGFWFRIMHWPLAGILIMVGIMVLFFVAFPWFVHVQWKDEPAVNARFIFMVVAPLLFVIPGALVNLNLERTYEEGFFIRMEKQDALIRLQEYGNKRILSFYNDPVKFSGMKSIQSATDELLGIIHHIKRNMVDIAEGPAGKPDPLLIELSGSNKWTQIQYRTLQRPFHPAPASLLLLPGCKARDILEKEIFKYKELLIQQFGSAWFKEYESLLKVSEYLPGSDSTKNSLLLLPNLNSLSLLESGILITESAALKQAVSKSKDI
jgi:hypothetical protein